MADIPQDGTIRTIDEDGNVPETRLKDASEARAVVESYVRSDAAERAWKRSRVKGLVDGNPPYKDGELRKAGLGKKLNINFGMSRAYLEAAGGAFYDIFSEAPTYATATSYYNAGPDKDYESVDQTQEWCGITTEEFHCLQTEEESFDYDMQVSQTETVLYGSGPLMFNDEFDFRVRSVMCGNLLLPEHAKSNSHYWETAVVLQDILSHDLYSNIRNSESATAVGWDVAYTRKAIMNAHPLTYDGGTQYRNWEWHQQNLKNGSVFYSSQSRVIRLAHVFIREFPDEDNIEGAISHKIILRDSMEDSEEKFLFEHLRRYENWNQCIHPMYYDHGGGGEHHSVTGMGVKMFGVMFNQNKLLCNLFDSAFAPKMMFRATTAANKQKLSIAQFSNYGIVPPELEFLQTQVQGYMQDAVGFNREITQIMASNLSQYRQQVAVKQGNPETATGREIDESQQSKLGKTQLNRYYDQQDYLYAEKFRRAINPKLTKSHPGGAKALEFQKRLRDRGVPREALDKMKVKATRIVGQGSEFERRRSLEFLLGLIGMLPESGRDNLIRMVVANRAGQNSVELIYPKSVQAKRPTDQEAFAMLQVSAMENGIAAKVTPTQNPIIFAETFLQAGSQALASLQQGADPLKVLPFMDLVGAASAAHIQRLSSDKSRKPAYDKLSEQLKMMGEQTDKVKALVQQQMAMQQEQRKKQVQAQAKAQAINNGTDPEVMIDNALAQHKMQTDNVKTAAKLKDNAIKTRQKLAINDLTAASKINLQKRTAEAKATTE